ncbi:MAG TPA: hypothetical protein VFQ26_06220 [Nitrospiraceae bacterium]|nr:hypothetical protein [Nitrospiraceae bacterium]
MKSDVMEFESYGDLMDDLTRLPPRTSVEYEIEHAVAAPVSVAQAMYILTSLSSSTPTFNQMALLLAKHVHGPGNSLKRLLPSVSPLNVLTYRQLYPLSNYYVTYKLDGERAAMMISGKSAAVMSDPSTVIEVVAFSTAEEKNAAAAPTVWLDGEWYQGSFYAFDVILPHAMRFSDRLRHLTSTIAALEASGVREKIYAKPYVFLGPDGITDTALSKMDSLAGDAETDGYIFIHKDSLYFDKKRPVLKWKPGEMSTIDLGMVERTNRPNEYILTVTATPEIIYTYGLNVDGAILDELARADRRPLWDRRAPNAIPYPFTTMLNPTLFEYVHEDDSLSIPPGGWCIGEFRWTADKWKLLRLRQDRIMGGGYFGNFYTVAESNWMNAEIPLTREALLSGNVGYFSRKDSRYAAQTKYSNAAKEYVYRKFVVHNAVVLDLGIGNGSDLFKYMRCHVKSVVGIDQDKNAMHTLMSRFLSIRKSLGNEYRGRLEVRLFHMSFEDLLNATKPLNQMVPIGEVDSVVWSFSFHYICYADDMVIKYAKFMSHVLAPEGTVIISIMDGNKLFGVLQKHGEFRRRFADGTDKYHVTSSYTEKKITNTGQKIQILLPFSGKDYYTEYLVNTEFLDSSMEKEGLCLVETINLTDPRVLKECNKLAVKLSQDDLDYLTLYCFKVYKKRSLN